MDSVSLKQQLYDFKCLFLAVQIVVVVSPNQPEISLDFHASGSDVTGSFLVFLFNVRNGVCG